MVIYVRVYEVSLEHIQGIYVRNGSWEEPMTVFGKEMSPSSDTFERDYLYWPACPRTLRFNCPHTSLWITFVLSGNKPTDECTRNDFTIIGIDEREEKAESCNQHSLHTRLILVFNDEDSILARMTIPWRVASDALSIHSARSAKVAWRIKSSGGRVKNMDFSTEMDKILDVVRDQACWMTPSV